MATESLISALRSLNLEIDVGNQDSRILIQKIAYLLKVKGFGIDFKFKRGTRGPYSFNLNKEVNMYRWQYDHLESSYELNEREASIVREIKESGVPLTVPRLEGATSAILLGEEIPERTEVEILKELGEWKETFSDEQLTQSIIDGKRLLLSNEPMSPEMKAELSSWEELGKRSIENSLT